jgi:inner membrane protein involved in colicin E2 resistance
MQRVIRILSPAGVLTAFFLGTIAVGSTGGLAFVYALFQARELLMTSAPSAQDVMLDLSALLFAIAISIGAVMAINRSITIYDDWECRRARTKRAMRRASSLSL